MTAHALDRQALLSAFATDESGLSGPEAERRLKEFGPNRLEGAKKKNYPLEYLRQYGQFFAIVLEIAAVLALIADRYEPGAGNDILGYAIFGAVVVNATFSFWQAYRADKAMEALLKLMPVRVNVRRSGATRSIDATDLAPGDIVLIEAGDKIAADGVLLEAASLSLDLAALNGESHPSRREAGASTAHRALEAKNMVFAGTTAVSGSGLAIVTATAHATEFGKIASLTKNVQKNLTPMQKEIIRITRILTAIALLMGAVFFALGLFSGKGALLAAIFALSLIVANVPEGLLPTITLSLSLAGQRMARRNALIKSFDSVETLGSATVICTDKTGTLTRNEMSVSALFLAGGEGAEVSGQGYREGGEFRFDAENSTTRVRLEELLLAGALNCRARIEAGGLYGDPTELAIVAAANKGGVHAGAQWEQIKEFPFSSERKLMSTLYKTPQGERLYVKGAPETVLERCRFWRNDEGRIVLFDDAARARIQSRIADYESQALRVLAAASKEGGDEEALTFLGALALTDPPRESVKEAIARCRSAGVRVMMITGDNPATAAAVARRIGLDFDEALSGDEVAKLSGTELKSRLENRDILFARMAGNQKLRITAALQENGEVVAMTGDGVNDAPALKKADIGIAMGRGGTEVAKEAADMILLDDNFASIVAAIEEGRTVYFNIKKFVTYILASNVPEIVPYVLQFFLKIPLPLSVIQILSIDLGSDMLPGLALGSERPEKNIMSRPPVGRNERILDWEVFKRGYLFIGLIEAAAAMSAFIGFLLLHGWQYGTVDLGDELLQRQAMTMTLLGAVTCQLFNLWTMRSWEFSVFSVGLFSNRLLLAATIFELVWIWALLNVAAVQEVFNTASIAAGDLWLLLPFPLLLFFGHEFYKWLRRRKAGPPIVPAA